MEVSFYSSNANDFKTLYEKECFRLFEYEFEKFKYSYHYDVFSYDSYWFLLENMIEKQNSILKHLAYYGVQNLGIPNKWFLEMDGVYTRKLIRCSQIYSNHHKTYKKGLPF